MPTNDGNADALIRRRHVLYVEGYDPQGAEGYHNLFSRSFRRFLKNWPLKTTVGDLQIDSDDLAHWTIDAAGPNWQVSTRYDFLRQEQMIRANMAEPMWRQVPRALGWMLNYLFTGTLFRIYRASHQYGLALTTFQMMLVWWLALSGFGGWLIGWLAMRFAGGPLAFGVIVGIVGGARLLQAAAPAGRQILRGADQQPLAVSAGIRARRAVVLGSLHRGRRAAPCRDRARQRADEIVVVGHSGGGVTAPAMVARALELDPDLGRHGPRIVLLTPGSLMPGIGLHRGAIRVHRDIARHRGRAVDSLDRRAGAGGHLEFLQFRSGRRHRHRRRARALQSAGLDRAAARHAGAGVLQEDRPELVSHALPVHHGERHARALRIHDAGVRAGAGRAMGAARPARCSRASPRTRAIAG